MSQITSSVKLISGTGTAISSSNPLPITTVNKTVYEAKSHSIADSTTDYDIKTTGLMFGTVTSATYCYIRTDREITVKFNLSTNGPIIIKATDSPYKIEFLTITNIFVTNASGGGATVNIEIF